jgi:uncharacterized protein YkwD
MKRIIYPAVILLCLLLGSFTLSGAIPPQEPAESYLFAVEDEIIRLTNEKRAASGLPALVPDERLTQASRMRSSEMFRYEYFSHLRPNGDAWHTVLDETGLSGRYASENIAKGSYRGVSGGALNIICARFWQNEWENSPPHLEAIIDPNVSSIGVGFYHVVKGDFVAVYGTVMFAALQSAD